VAVNATDLVRDKLIAVRDLQRGNEARLEECPERVRPLGGLLSRVAIYLLPAIHMVGTCAIHLTTLSYSRIRRRKSAIFDKCRSWFHLNSV